MRIRPACRCTCKRPAATATITAPFARRLSATCAALKSAQESRYLVGDAALYCAETLHLLHHQRQLFITACRAP